LPGGIQRFVQRGGQLPVHSYVVNGRQHLRQRVGQVAGCLQVYALATLLQTRGQRIEIFRIQQRLAAGQRDGVSAMEW